MAAPPETAPVAQPRPWFVRHLVLVGKILLSAFLLWWLARSLKPAELRLAFSRFDAGVLVAGLALFVGQGLVMSWRWHRIVSLLGGRLSFGRAIRWVFIGLFFNQALPSTVGGDAVRVWLLHRDGTAKGAAFSSVFLERSTGLVITGLLVSVCLPSIWTAIAHNELRYVLLFAGPVLLTLLLSLGFVGPRLAALLPGRSSAAVVDVMDSIRKLVAQPPAAAEMTVLGTLSALLGFGVVYLLGQRLGLDLSIVSYVSLVGGAILLSVLPISLGGWGLRELSMVALFGAVGVKAADALAMSIAYGVLALLVALPGGLAWLRVGVRGSAARADLRAD